MTHQKSTQPIPLQTPNRRHALQAMAAGVGASLLPEWNRSISNAAQPDPPDPQAYIDAHVHVWTPETTAYPLASGFEKDDMQPASFTPEELFAHARPCDVKRVVLIQMSFYGYDNSYMLEMMRTHKGVFSGVAVIDASAHPIDRMKQLKQHGVRAFRIRPQNLKPDQWLAVDGMDAMWKCGADENLGMGLLIDPEFLPSVDAMCRRFPKTPVVIDHFARIGVDGTIRDRDLDNLCKLAKHALVTVKVSAYYALGKKTRPYRDLLAMIKRLVAEFGADRLMWASDCPFQVIGDHDYKTSIDLIRREADFLSTEDRDWLLRKTAERVYF